MTINAPPRFFGPVAIILALALPAGLMSALSPTTTGEIVDAADDIIVARIESKLQLEDPERTVLMLEVKRTVMGDVPTGDLIRTLEGRTRLRAGDTAVFMFAEGTEGILGHLHLVKSEWESGYEVATPVTGMAAQGLPHHGPAMHVADFVSAVMLRRGLTGSTGEGGSKNFAIAPPSGITTISPDAFEDNNTQLDAAAITLGALGDTTSITGLTLTRDDVDFFSFTEGQGLVKLVAETLAPPPSMATTDTVLGLFDGAGNLVAFDEDGGDEFFSRLEVSLGGGGDFALAVAPFGDEDFDGSGASIPALGPYDLSVRRMIGNYLWNVQDLHLGISPDGSFGEDSVGFKPFTGHESIASARVDGWGVEYFIDRMPSGVTAIAFGGGGEFWTAPGFTNTLLNKEFELGGFTDAFGQNRRGFGRSATVVAHEVLPTKGVGIDHEYRWSNGQRIVKGEITVRVPRQQNIDDVVYERLIDINLFGSTDNQFYWSFDPSSNIQAFAVDAGTTVGGIPQPIDSEAGPVTDDLQMALVIDHGTGGLEVDGRFDLTRYPAAFAMVQGHASASDAKDAVEQLLERCGMETWVIAVDQDRDTGDWGAFGAGLGEP